MRPAQSDYAEAVQNPQLAFKDSRLRVARPQVNPLGMPRSSSGGFAIAFQLNAGTQSWAVRCFTHDSADLSGRYAAISDFLHRNGDEHFVPIEYIPEGIRVGTGWWPVTVMPWVGGVALNDWVASTLGDRSKIAEMRIRFAALIRSLEHAGLAHGDLQHGNVLVRPNGSLVLIDYDGMYVPAMQGRAMPEGGQSNYQHPGRVQARFGPTLDRFAAAVIWSAFEVLEHEPRLWARFDNGENMLFRSGDFIEPDSSELLAELRALPALRHVADRIDRLSRCSIDALPQLEDVVAGRLPVLPAGGASATPLPSLAPYQVVDLRRGDAPRYEGERVLVVGEVTGFHKSTTRNGDPYAFLPLGARGTQSVNVVVWSQVLDALGWPPGRPPGRGEIVAVTGLLTRYQDKLQIELERAALLETLAPAQVVRTLGSPWAAAPPVAQRLTHPRVGDRVRHEIYGSGVVSSVHHDTVQILFGVGAKSIQYTKYFLTLEEPAGPGLQGTARPRTPWPPAGKPAGPTVTRTSAPPSAPTGTAKPIGGGPHPPVPSATVANGPQTLDKRGADVLNSLYASSPNSAPSPQVPPSSPASSASSGPTQMSNATASRAIRGRNRRVEWVVSGSVVGVLAGVGALAAAGQEAAIIVGISAAALVVWAGSRRA